MVVSAFAVKRTTHMELHQNLNVTVFVLLVLEFVEGSGGTVFMIQVPWLLKKVIATNLIKMISCQLCAGEITFVIDEFNNNSWQIKLLVCKPTNTQNMHNAMGPLCTQQNTLELGH